MSFAIRLQKLRRERNLSVEAAAKQIGISRQTLNHYENGASLPNGEVLLMICKVYETTPNYLLLGEEKSEAAKPVSPAEEREEKRKRTAWRLMIALFSASMALWLLMLVLMLYCIALFRA